MCGRAPCDSPACTWGETHRRECEARSVMRWPQERRQAYYAEVKKRRGDAALRGLVTEASKQWKLSQCGV